MKKTVKYKKYSGIAAFLLVSSLSLTSCGTKISLEEAVHIYEEINNEMNKRDFFTVGRKFSLKVKYDGKSGNSYSRITENWTVDINVDLDKHFIKSVYLNNISDHVIFKETTKTIYKSSYVMYEENNSVTYKLLEKSNDVVIDYEHIVSIDPFSQYYNNLCSELYNSSNMYYGFGLGVVEDTISGVLDKKDYLKESSYTFISNNTNGSLVAKLIERDDYVSRESEVKIDDFFIKYYVSSIKTQNENSYSSGKLTMKFDYNNIKYDYNID